MLNRYLPHSDRAVADCLIEREGLLTAKWSYDYGVVWRGMAQLYGLTGDRRYFDYIYGALDLMVDPQGRPAGYSPESCNLDYLMNGRLLNYLYKETGEARFLSAARLLRSQLDIQPRTSDGGFWHKKVYPYQMWLDGQHMAIPFYLEYETEWGGERAKLSDAARQLILAFRHTVDPATGLPCHGWDEKRVQPWADPVTGRSAHAWGRAVGWYMTALADSLPLLPRDLPEYPEVLDIYRTLSERLLSIRRDGVWLQVLDAPDRLGNYKESSGSCLIVYALLRGAREGLLPAYMGDEAAGSFEQLQRHFLGQMRSGEYFVAKCCQGAGLGGKPVRDGSFDYYISENVISRDLKATGAYIQAACEDRRRREGL